MKIYAAALISLLFVSPVFSQKNIRWSIGDYLRNLPEKYKTFSGDFPAPTTETTVTDDKNGYAAYLSSPAADSFPIFEMAIFKKANGDVILVVSNTISDPVCTQHETFFLQEREGVWTDVSPQILPKLSTQMFFSDIKLAAKFRVANKMTGNRDELNLHFSPPRAGTRMKVSLDICDHVPDELTDKIAFGEFIENAKPVLLDWDKQRGVFKRTN